MSRVVFGVGTSRTFRVHWTLAELRLSYESRSIRPRTSDTEDPEFRAVSPHGKVPVFCDGALVLRESAAIAFHLAERYGTPGQLMPPAGSDARAIHDQWCWFAVAELDETSLYVIRRRPTALTRTNSASI